MLHAGDEGFPCHPGGVCLQHPRRAGDDADWLPPPGLQGLRREPPGRGGHIRHQAGGQPLRGSRRPQRPPLLEPPAAKQVPGRRRSLHPPSHAGLLRVDAGDDSGELEREAHVVRQADGHLRLRRGLCRDLHRELPRHPRDGCRVLSGLHYPGREDDPLRAEEPGPRVRRLRRRRVARGRHGPLRGRHAAGDRVRDRGRGECAGASAADWCLLGPLSGKHGHLLPHQGRRDHGRDRGHAPPVAVGVQGHDLRVRLC
mmetsp:Transcript_19658/g.59294  ORF Transcript_19658/g.59294 Transcript_19658/m.59294 type:complete len:256 (-) Transcript_19658:470-1237(-)